MVKFVILQCILKIQTIMKTLLTSFVLLFSVIVAFPQVTHYQMDSMSIPGLSKTVYMYDANRRLETANRYSYDYDLDSIVLDSRSNYYYNQDGQLIEEVEQNFDFTMDAWDNFARTVYHFNGPLKASTVNYSFSTQWVYEDSIAHIYDYDEYLVYDTTYYHLGRAWDYDQYTVYVRDAIGEIQSDTNFVYNSGSGVWVFNRLNTYQYSDDLLSDEETFGWNPDSLEWEPQDKMSYEYDQHDNIEATINYDTDSADNWKYFMKTEVYYDYSVSAGQMDYPDNGDMDAFVNVPKIDSAGIFSWQDSIWSDSYLPVYFHYSTYLGVDNEQVQEIKLYPNPVSTELHMETNGDAVYQVFDVKGAVIMQGKLTESAGSIIVNHLDPGLYILQLTGNDNVSMQYRFIKQ